MQKTPVSILQEMMVKKGTVPHYELIHDGGGTHENTFTYQVSCQGLFATGTGRCKKDAKHLAANNMLETIAAENNYPALPPISGESPVKMKPAPHILSADERFVNDIGELQDLCAEHGLPDPIYETVGDEGPAHAKIFTIHCKVFTLVEEGRQTTKKHAKHLAARKMSERMKNLIDNAVNTYEVVKNSVEQNNPYPDNNLIVPVDNIDTIDVSDFSKSSLHSKSSLGLKLSEFHTKLYTTYDEMSRDSVITELIQFSDYYLENDDTLYDDYEFYSYLEELKMRFNEVISPLNITAIFFSFPIMKKTAECTMSIILNSVPQIAECVIGKSNDKKLLKSLFVRIVKTLSLLLSECR